MRIAVLCLLFVRTLVGMEPVFEREPLRETVYRGATYFCAGSFLETFSLLARGGWGLCHLLPQKAISKNECWLLSDICSEGARLAYAGPCDRSDWCRTWLQNQQLLAQAPVVSKDDDNLRHFLQDRWLTKMAGISRIGLEWVYPCFGLTVQANPTSNHAYARLASSHMTEAYKKRMEAWKLELGTSLPLILTRSADIGRFLPLYFSMGEPMETVVGQLGTKAIVDFTGCSGWENRFSQACAARGLNGDEILCIERVEGEGIGGIQILPFPSQSPGAAAKQHTFLLESLSRLGLIANWIELDRGSVLQEVSGKGDSAIKIPDRSAFFFALDSLEAKCLQVPDHKKILIEGTFRITKGLFGGLNEQKWEKILASPTRSFLTWLSMVKVKQQLQHLSEHLADPLFEIALQLEQVHADLSTLLEVLTPFTSQDFSQIYRDLIAIPAPLEPLTSYGIHSSGMTCFAAIVKAVEKDLGSVHAIYGENSYYECAAVLEQLARSSSRADLATEEEWQRANLLLVQFNPAVRVDWQHEQYQLENIDSMIRKCLNSRSGVPLTLALDGTLDLIASNRIATLLDAFSSEILDGELNVIVFRSGNKFDLLGMDNYSGAPFYLVRSGKPSFDFLFTDPVLQCDQLSLNWFCLAYRSSAAQLEQYKKQIFANTRSLLDKVPKALEQKGARYRIVPMARDADPAFVDIKITGPFQKIKAAALVIPYLFLESMKGKQPIFTRPSLGFYHPNISVIFEKDCSTVRLTLGLDPAQVDVFAKCFVRLASLMD